MKEKFLLYNLLLLILLCSNVLLADNYVIINQVMYDTPLLEQNLSGSHPYNGEFIELYNAGEETVSLNGWSIKGYSQSEKWTFSNITLPPEAYLLLACRRGQGNIFQLADLYESLQDKNITIIYQNKIIMANDGETLTLFNAQNDTVDYMYYGKPDNTYQDLLHAINADGLIGDQCVSLHRKWVEFDTEGKVVPNISKWATSLVTFGENILPYDSYNEHNLIGVQTLPNGTNGAENENYVLAITPIDPTARIDIKDGGISVSSAIRTYTTVQYLDGLGRTSETIALGVTPNGDDMVSIMEDYDNVSRQWLPAIMQTQGQRKDISDVQAQAIMDYGERPYTETRYESAGRQIKQYRPGEEYENSPMVQTAEFNSANEVLLFTVNANGDLHSSGTYYNPTMLYKTTITDEDGKSVVTYTDMQGRKVMDKHGTSEVYYVYDDIGRLRYVLPNISSKLIATDYSLDDVLLKSDAYCYGYDVVGNMVYKRLPGCEPQLMVYDQLGKLVLTQDGNQRVNGNWAMCTYDSIGRVLYTAEIRLTQTHEELITYFADKWQVEHYGNNHSFPIAGTGYASRLLKNEHLHPLTINYYDNYEYLNILPTPLRQVLRFEQEAGYGSKYENATGLLVGTRVYNLSEEGYTATSYYYDDNGRIIQSRSVRSTDEYKIVTSAEYLYDGSVAQQLSVQGYDDESLIREHYQYKYDHVGRALNVKYQLNDEPEISLSKMSYDKYGRLAQNILHGEDTICYSYDIRNTLTDINNKHFSEKLYYADNLPEFATTPCHNGSITAATITKNGVSRHFAYTYDEHNRLLEMEQKNSDIQSSAENIRESYTYDLSGNITSLIREYAGRLIDNLDYSYGDNGNQLQAIADNGRDVDNFNCIEYHDTYADDTEMFYDANGNLVKDLDRGIDTTVYNILNLPDTIKFHNGNQIVNLYDASGRKYKSTIYTVPESIETPYHNVAEYAYDTDLVDYDYHVINYLGNIEVHNTQNGADISTSLKIHNAIGYWTDGMYYHTIKDHLGNVCAVVKTETGELVQSAVYYASGVLTPLSESRGEQPYLYNGKELIEDSSMEYNVYDYGFRGYYAPIGRFTSMDPLAESTPWQSPYSYANNNFINNIDYMGLFGTSPNDGFSSGSGMDQFAFDNSNVFVDGDRYGFGGGLNNPEWGLWSWSMFSGLLGGFGVQTLNYIIVDENGIVLDADLSSPDKGIYQVDRKTYLFNLKSNDNKLDVAHKIGKNIGTHVDVNIPAVLLIGQKLDISWYDFSAHTQPVYVHKIDPQTGKVVASIQMSQEDYLRMLNENATNNQGTIQSPDLLQYYNSFERGMITSPVIQGVAVGGLGVLAFDNVSGMYFLLQNSSIAQFGAGFAEGWGKGLMGAGPDVPYLNESPAYQAGSSLGSFLYEIFH